MIFSRRSVEATILVSLAILAVAFAGFFEKNETGYVETEIVETASKSCDSSFQINSIDLPVLTRFPLPISCSRLPRPRMDQPNGVERNSLYD
jgi:hypothetical protein